MNNKILYFIICISLAFNIAFIGMFLRHRNIDHRLPDRRDFPAVREIIRHHPEHFRERRSEFLQERKMFMDYIRSEDFDESIADSLLQNMLHTQRQSEEFLGKEIIEMRKRGEIFEKKYDRPPNDKTDYPKRRKK
jgi:hypothetical protein